MGSHVMSCELARELYLQARDRLERYVNEPPPSHDDRLAPGPGERLQEQQRLANAARLAGKAYAIAKAEHVDVPRGAR